MQLGQGRDGLGDLVREHPRDGRRHARELRVAPREVGRAVQLFEEVARGRPVSIARQQVRVGVREAALLERLQRDHLRGQTRQRGALLPLAVDGLEVTGKIGRRV
jgi:hypothetical protein